MREPSVTMQHFGKPSCVICVVPAHLGGGIGEKNHHAARPRLTAPATARNPALRFSLVEGPGPVLSGTWVGILPVFVSRFRRLRSALSSAADWQRTSRSFSSALLITSSSLAGIPGFKRTGATGGRFKI